MKSLIPKTTLFTLFTALACSSEADTAMPGNGRSVANGDASASVPAVESNHAPAVAESSPLDREERRALIAEIVGDEFAAKVLPESDQMRSVYSVDLPSGVTVEWLEPTAGRALVAVRGDLGTSFDFSIANRPLSAGELFKALAPEREVPTELTALDQRMVDMAPVYDQLEAARVAFPELETQPLLEEPSALPGNTLQDPLSDGQFGVVSEALSVSDCLKLQNINVCQAGAGETWLVSYSDRTSDPPRIYRDDARVAKGFGCEAAGGRVNYRVRHKEWFSWTTRYQFDLSMSFVGVWSFMLDNDFDFEAKLTNFVNGAHASHCAEGR